MGTSILTGEDMLQHASLLSNKMSTPEETAKCVLIIGCWVFHHCLTSAAMVCLNNSEHSGGGEDEQEGKSSSLQNRIMANNKKKVLKRLKRCICTVILSALLTATAHFRGPGFELQPLCLRSSLLLTCTLEAAGAGSRSDFPVPRRQLQPWLLQEFEEKPSRGKASVLKIVHKINGSFKNMCNARF